MPQKADRQIPSFSTANWKKTRIIVRSDGGSTPTQSISVYLMPHTRGGIAVGEDDRDFFNRNAAERTYMHLSHGVYTLYRQITHMLLGHEKELPLVEQVRAVARETRVQFDLLGQAENQRWVEAEIRDKIFETLDLLGRVRNDHKVEAKTQFEIMIPLKDSLGRRNVGVLKCRSLRALDKLMKRLEEIRCMDPFIQYRLAVVRAFIGHVENKAVEIQADLEKVYELLTKPMAGNTKLALELATEAKDNARWFGVKPYWRPYDRHLRADLASLVHFLEAALENDEPMWAEEAVKTAQVSRMCLRGLRARAKMEHARVHLSTWHKHPNLYSPEMQRKIVSVFERMHAVELPAIDDSLFDTPVFTDVRARFTLVVQAFKEETPDFRQVVRLLDSAMSLI